MIGKNPGGHCNWDGEHLKLHYLRDHQLLYSMANQTFELPSGWLIDIVEFAIKKNILIYILQSSTIYNSYNEITDLGQTHSPSTTIILL